jgi:hypothetical protein
MFFLFNQNQIYTIILLKIEYIRYKIKLILIIPNTNIYCDKNYTIKMDNPKTNILDLPIEIIYHIIKLTDDIFSIDNLLLVSKIFHNIIKDDLVYICSDMNILPKILTKNIICINENLLSKISLKNKNIFEKYNEILSNEDLFNLQIKGLLLIFKYNNKFFYTLNEIDTTNSYFNVYMKTKVIDVSSLNNVYTLQNLDYPKPYINISSVYNISRTLFINDELLSRIVNKETTNLDVVKYLFIIKYYYLIYKKDNDKLEMPFYSIIDKIIENIYIFYKNNSKISSNLQLMGELIRLQEKFDKKKVKLNEKMFEKTVSLKL